MKLKYVHQLVVFMLVPSLQLSFCTSENPRQWKAIGQSANKGSSLAEQEEQELQEALRMNCLSCISMIATQ